MRIVSLIPSGTDIAAALGLTAHLVGVSHECDHPAAAGLPVVTSSALPVDASPAEIDQLVSSAAAAGDTIYRTNLPRLHELEPDVILTQDICDVCAVPASQVSCDVPPGAELVTLSATTLAGLDDDLLRVGKATGADDVARAAVDQLAAQRDDMRQRTEGQPRPRVAAVEWGDPPFTAGDWVPELIDVAGGECVLGAAGERSRRATWDDVRAAAPDVVVFMPCGYELDQAVAEAASLPWDGPLWATDSTHLFSRCTPQAVGGGLDVLAAILHEGQPDPAQAVRVR
jgi:iron complex transport system substrate-binding protein